MKAPGSTSVAVSAPSAAMASLSKPSVGRGGRDATGQVVGRCVDAREDRPPRRRRSPAARRPRGGVAGAQHRAGGGVVDRPVDASATPAAGREPVVVGVASVTWRAPAGRSCVVEDREAGGRSRRDQSIDGVGLSAPETLAASIHWWMAAAAIARRALVGEGVEHRGCRACSRTCTRLPGFEPGALPAEGADDEQRVPARRVIVTGCDRRPAAARPSRSWSPAAAQAVRLTAKFGQRVGDHHPVGEVERRGDRAGAEGGADARRGR